MKRIGFFGGSFDPIHFGHIALAISLLEQHTLDEVLFCPAFCSPFKVDSPPRVDGKHRLKMLELALDYPKFRATSMEIDRGATSYTIDTLKALQKEGVQWKLLLSDETAKSLPQWKEAKEIVQIAEPLIGTKDLQISSTKIRHRLKKRLYCAHLIPSKVLDYIFANDLYSE